MMWGRNKNYIWSLLCTFCVIFLICISATVVNKHAYNKSNMIHVALQGKHQQSIAERLCWNETYLTKKLVDVARRTQAREEAGTAPCNVERSPVDDVAVHPDEFASVVLSAPTVQPHNDVVNDDEHSSQLQ